MFEKILVAIDGSDHSAKALEIAGDLASLSGGEVRIVHVREVPLGLGGALAEPEQPTESATIVDDAVASLSARQVAGTGTIRVTHTGHTAAEIVQEAGESGATLIVVGSTGVTSLAGLILGSVSHKILHLATIPVLIAR